MTSRAEVLVCGCCDEDVAVLRSAVRPGGPALRTISSPVKAAHRAVADHPLALVLGIGKENLSWLEVIPVIRAAGGDLPVIVVAEEESLELERAARRKGIFYYLVRPLEAIEVHAVFNDVLRVDPTNQVRKP